ncbi:hypothetical protein [Methanobrevibacter arboriphilus]|uniref:Uncharacterized protein n=1 Tax=Methanobrevibacter arboriphilus TaxID=39441 RepID=A0ACA8R719_METAZ|nr:hypothetical protein [Methanobrevibacter arboriphilus]BBL62850.1 hypothetical protein MarbSA_18900 [Methanobrevibacter arboriphilus]
MVLVFYAKNKCTKIAKAQMKQVECKFYLILSYLILSYFILFYFILYVDIICDLGENEDDNTDIHIIF